MAEPTDPALQYRGWVHVGTAARLAQLGSVRAQRFDRSIVVTADATGGVVAVDVTEERTRVPAIVIGGVVFVYHRAPGDDLDLDPPPPGEGIAASFLDTTRFRSSFHFQIHTSLPALVENAVDRAHFTAVHARHCDSAGPYTTDVREGGSFCATVDLGKTIPPCFHRQGRMEFELFDPFSSRARATMLHRTFDTLAFAAPMGQRNIDILFVTLSPRWWPVIDRVLHLILTASQRVGIRDDARVLSTRTIASHPVLSDADGPILSIRQWLTAFRSPVPDSPDSDVPEPLAADA